MDSSVDGFTAAGFTAAGFTAAGFTPEGFTAEGFERVADVFTENFATRKDTGSAFAVVVDGELVVDLWGGVADKRTGHPWTGDTVTVMHSGTKGVVATALLLLVQSGQLDLHAPVAAYWPEFAVKGKEAVTVAMLAAHAGGVPGLESPIVLADLQDPSRIAAMLAAQAPMVPIGAPSYHALTFGWLCNEIIRRVDGRTTGRFVADEIAGPLGLDLRIGMRADDVLAGRMSYLERASDYQLTAMLDPNPDDRLAFVYGLIGSVIERMDDPAVLALEIPAANGVASSRAMARLYGTLACGGGGLLDPTVLAVGTTLASKGDDPLSGRPLRFGPTGYELAHTPSALGPPDDAFGHTGAGGTSFGAWPSLWTGFAYSSNMMRPEPNDGRARALLDALHAVLTGTATARAVSGQQ